MDGCLKVIICLTNPLGWIYLIWEGIENAGRQAKILEQKAYFDSLNPKTRNDLGEIDIMNGHTFEHYVAHILSKNDYSNVSVTSGSNDFGVDILAEKGSHKYAIQVKRQQSRVSRRAVSDALAGAAHYSCNKYMVVTNNYMTASGLEFANSVNCIVIDRDKLIPLIESANVTSPSIKKDDFEDIFVEPNSIKSYQTSGVKSSPKEKKEEEMTQVTRNEDVWEDIIFEPDTMKKNK